MKQTLVTGNEAAAWGARLVRAKYIPNFPITPQTECIETLAQWSGEYEISPQAASAQPNEYEKAITLALYLNASTVTQNGNVWIL